jgi:hypothetical protein
MNFGTFVKAVVPHYLGPTILPDNTVLIEFFSEKAIFISAI